MIQNAARSAVSRAGTGGRSSWSGHTVTVFGATGFVGRYVVARLGEVGTTVMVPHRGCEWDARHLKVCGDYGKVAPMPFDVRNRDTVEAALENSDVCINLIGKSYETKHLVGSGRDRINFSFDDVHVAAAEQVAEACKAQGVGRLIHVSALGADASSGSEWLRSKAAGEAAVRAAFPQATVVRPGVIFGPEDRFLNLYANLLKVSAVKAVPLADGGHARVAPVYVDDVAGAITAVLENADLDGSTLELQGPDELELREMIQFVADTIEVECNIFEVPDKYFNVLGWVAENFPSPWITRDQLRLNQQDRVRDIASDALSLNDLGIEPTTLEKSFMYLHRYRSGGHFNVEGSELTSY